MQTFANNAYGFLASGVSAVATTLTLGTGEGARFPTTSGDNFKVTLIALTNGQETAWEIVNVTARSSDTLTVQRAQEGTTGLVWPSLTRVELRLTAGATESKANLGTAAYKNIPASGNASATEVVYGSDTRLSDARTPASHTTASHSDWPAAVSMTELGYLDGVTSAIQTQLGAKQTGATALTAISNLTPTDGNVIVGDGTTWVAESGATARTSLGLGTAATMTGPSGTLVGTTDTQTLSGKTLTDPAIIGAIAEDVFTLTDGAAFEIDPGNGSIQLVTLGANRTPKGTNFSAGESVTLMVLDGSTYTLTWTDTTFGTSGVVWVGETAPSLDTTKYTVIELWKVGGQVYGALVGAA